MLNPVYRLICYVCVAMRNPKNYDARIRLVELASQEVSCLPWEELSRARSCYMDVFNALLTGLAHTKDPDEQMEHAIEICDLLEYLWSWGNIEALDETRTREFLYEIIVQHGLAE